ncbi:MAG: glycosyltransferase family 2 protein [Lentimicrobiaceae bacterium]|jgi:glycosyltransferase involved in cell wall biosynthesis|nr:glycosyltransferase family 2 protein [Lentimicrobiaceae bacterium]
MDKLSVAIITFNEERNIERCLQSVVAVADEIVVLDSLSTDNTKAICERYPVRFFEQKFAGYIEQKNDALQLCAFENVLSLDADEALSDKLRQTIQTAKEKGFDGGYSMNRLTNYCGKWIRHCGWYPDTKLRLIQKSKARWIGLNPHDKLEYFDKKTPIHHLQGDLLHYSFYTIEDHKKQIESFSSLGAKSYFKTNRKTSISNIYLSPIARFLKQYFLKLGFLDGKAGFQICRLSALATYKKYKKLRQLIRDTKKQL